MNEVGKGKPEKKSTKIMAKVKFKIKKNQNNKEWLIGKPKKST